MKRHVLVAFGLTLYMMCAGAAPISARCEDIGADSTCAMHGVSLIELIANPHLYDGKRVRVLGYLNLEFEGNALYLHKEDYEHSLSKNSLWVEVDKEQRKIMRDCKSKSYVLLEGTFNAANRGHFGLWSGAIESLSRCSPWR